MNSNALVALIAGVVLGVTAIAAWQLPVITRWPLVVGAAVVLLTPYRGERPIHVVNGTELLGSAKSHLGLRFTFGVLLAAVAVVLEFRARREYRRESEYLG
jgi:hypothetical protein